MLGSQQLVQVALYAVLALCGILSFFSPAVLHSTSSAVADKTHAALRTIAFAVGIAVPIMGLGYLAALIGVHITAPRLLVVRIAGVGIAALGVLEIVPISAGLLQRKFLLPSFSPKSPIALLLHPFYLGTRLILGWVPSFSPIVLAMLLFALSVNSIEAGLFSIIAFTVGLVVALLGSRLAVSQITHITRSYVGSVRIWMKVCGIGLIIIGFMVLTGWMNSATDYLSPVTIPPNETAENSSTTNSSNTDTTTDTSTNSNITTSTELVTAPDFDLADQFGVYHKLSDYEGTIVVLVFWSTESKASVSALGDLQSYYTDMILAAQKQALQETEAQSSSLNAASTANVANMAESSPTSSTATVNTRPTVTVLTVVMPARSSSTSTTITNSSSTISNNTSTQQQKAALLASFASSSKSDITTLIASGGYTFPVLLDSTGASFQAYGVDGLPKTYVITTDGRIAGSVTGALTADQLKRIVDEGIATEATSASNTSSSTTETTNTGN